jgi:hypothetical protein
VREVHRPVLQSRGAHFARCLLCSLPLSAEVLLPEHVNMVCTRHIAVAR